MFKRIQIEKLHLITTYLVTIIERKVTLLKNSSLGDSLSLKVFFNGCPNATLISLTLKDPMKIGYLLLLFDSISRMSWLYGENVVS